MAIPPPVLPNRKTIRMQLMEEFRKRLGRIRVSNGYQTNVGESVWQSRQPTAEPHILPIIYYWDDFQVAEPRMGSRVYTLQVQVETYDRVLLTTEQQAIIDQGIARLGGSQELTPEEMQIFNGNLAIVQQMHVIANQQLADLEVALHHDALTGKYDEKFCGLAHSLRCSQSEIFNGIWPSQTLWCGSVSQWELVYEHAAGDPYRLRRAA